MARMEVFSMGMFCIDEIHLPHRSLYRVIGGAGTYAALGAGVLLAKADRGSVGFICDEGRDFPAEMRAAMQSWGLGTVSRVDNTRETTKAWNKFVNNEERLFKYLSPKRQIFARDLPPEALAARAMHLICSPQRCADILTDLGNGLEPAAGEPAAAGGRAARKLVWEPVPTECTPAQFEALKTVVQTYAVDVLSPNALEAAALAGLPEPRTKGEVEQLVLEHFGFAPCVVVRCGALGSFLRTRTLSRWYPPYFEDAARVKDASGAGNAFVGALALAVARGLDWDAALAYASVGASFMIEQVGPPRYDVASDLWNGETGQHRLQLYVARLANAPA